MKPINKIDELYKRRDNQKDVGTFDIKLGSQIGIETSMIFNQIVDLCRAVGDNVSVYEDRNWILISSETLHQEEYFSWIPARTIRYSLQKLENLDLLISRIDEHSVSTVKYYSPDLDLAYAYIYAPESIIKKVPRQELPASRQELPAPANNVSINKVVKRLKIKDLSIKDSFQPVERPRDLMFDAVAKVCVLDPKLQGSRIARTSNLLKKSGYVPEDVLQFLTWWKSNDFRWRQSKQPPLPEDITTLIARSKSRTKTSDEPTNLFPADYMPGETGKEYSERKHDVTN